MIHLASVCNIDTLMNTNIQLVAEDYSEQLFVPGGYRVIFFHDESDQVVANTITTADPQILKETGDTANPTAATNRRATSIKYVTVEAIIDFTQITEDNLSKFRVSTVVELPMTSRQISDNVAGVVNVTIYHGPADIRTMSAEELKTKS